jgi:hypothetical protein
MGGLSASELRPEELHAGEYIEYYSPRHGFGDPRDYRTARVIRVGQADDRYPLKLTTDELLSVYGMVKRFQDAHAHRYPRADTKWRKIRSLTLCEGHVENATERDVLVATLRRVRATQFQVSMTAEFSSAEVLGSALHPIVVDSDLSDSEGDYEI